MPQVSDLVRQLQRDGHRDLATSLLALPGELYVTDLVNLLYRCPIEQMQTDPYTRSLILQWQDQTP